MALRLRMLMPPTRLPCGAPVPVGVQPTSSRRKAGGTKSMICQRSTGVVKPPARAVVAQAMVVALQMIADELSHGKRQVAVDAAVLKRDGRAVLFAEEHDRLAEDHPPERLACNLVVRGGDVPEIFQEHWACLLDRELYCPQRDFQCNERRDARRM